MNLTSKEKVLLKFMEMTIGRVNTCLLNIHALQSILIDKKVITIEELRKYVNEAAQQPNLKIGRQVLNSMIGDLDATEHKDFISKLESMVNFSTEPVIDKPNNKSKEASWPSQPNP